MKIFYLHNFQNEREMEATEYIAGYIKHKIERKFPAQSVYKLTCFVLIRFLEHFFSLINLFMIIKIQLFLVYEAGEGVSYIYLMNE